MNEEIANPEVSRPEVSGADAGYDETAGVVYEVEPHGYEIPGLRSAENAAAQAAGAQAGGTPAGDEPPTLVEPTTVGGLPLQPADDEGPVLNQTMASAPRPVEEGRERSANPFRQIFGRRGSGALPGDGEPPLTRVRDLPFDLKMRIWRMRALIVVVVGVVFTIIASWEVGITLAIVAGIADTVYRARTVEAGHMGQPGTVDRATLRAQKNTIKQLAGMERAGYLSLHKRPIPDSPEVIDHLVIGPTGVYAIDSEKWPKDMPIRQRNSKQLYVGPESKKERLDHAHWEAGQASERLSARTGMEITVQPALAIYGPKLSWVVLPVRGVDVFNGKRLKSYLIGRTKRAGIQRLTSEQIQKIYAAAGDVLPLEWQNPAAPVG